MMVVQELNGGVFDPNLYAALTNEDYTIYSVALSMIRSTILAKLASAEVITLDIGANDLFNAFALEAQQPGITATTLTNMTEILQGILACIDMSSDAKVFFGNYWNPYSYESDPRHIAFDQLNACIAGAIYSFNQLAEGDVVPVVLEGLLTSERDAERYVSDDQIHPTQLGYQLMAKEFWGVMRNK